MAARNASSAGACTRSSTRAAYAGCTPSQVCCTLAVMAGASILVDSRAAAVPSGARAVCQLRAMRLVDLLGSCQRPPYRQMRRKGFQTGLALCQLQGDNVCQSVEATSPAERRSGITSCSSNYVVSCRGQGGGSWPTLVYNRGNFCEVATAFSSTTVDMLPSMAPYTVICVNEVTEPSCK